MPGIPTKNIIDPELGVVRQCKDCGEYWPADREFFWPANYTGLSSYCRACQLERKRKARIKKNQESIMIIHLPTSNKPCDTGYCQYLRHSELLLAYIKIAKLLKNIPLQLDERK